jgi:hypothetical protein
MRKCPIRKPFRAVLTGLLGKEHSIGTGLLIALLVWTLTRLVDGVTIGGTIEYDTTFSRATLANGQSGMAVSVVLTNLSHDTIVKNLRALVYDPGGTLVFDTDRRDCGFEPPAWAQDATCTPDPTGMNFVAPMLVPGTSAKVVIKYSDAKAPGTRPVVRIGPDDSSKARLVMPGVETFVARFESYLLFALSMLTMGLLFLSIARGTQESPPPKADDTK